jgi:hypothetical protein
MSKTSRGFDIVKKGDVRGIYPVGSGILRTMHSVVMELEGVVVPPGHKIIHINGIKTDNRRVNLRVVEKSFRPKILTNHSYGRDPAPVELVALGIARLPGYMHTVDRHGEMSFSGEDHPDARNKGVVVKEPAVGGTLLSRLHDCIQNFCEMYDTIGQADDDPEVAERINLLMQYDRISRSAHAHDSDLFPSYEYVDFEGIMPEPMFCRYLLVKVARILAFETKLRQVD